MPWVAKAGIRSSAAAMLIRQCPDLRHVKKTLESGEQLACGAAHLQKLQEQHAYLPACWWQGREHGRLPCKAAAMVARRFAARTPHREGRRIAAVSMSHGEWSLVRSRRRFRRTASSDRTSFPSTAMNLPTRSTMLQQNTPGWIGRTRHVRTRSSWSAPCKHRAQLINIQRRGRRKEEEEEERTARTPDGRDSRDLGRARDHQMLFASLSFRDGDGGSRQGDLVRARRGPGQAKRSEGPRPGDRRPIVRCACCGGDVATGPARSDSGAKRGGFLPPTWGGKARGEVRSSVGRGTRGNPIVVSRHHMLVGIPSLRMKLQRMPRRRFPLEPFCFKVSYAMHHHHHLVGCGSWSPFAFGSR